MFCVGWWNYYARICWRTAPDPSGVPHWCFFISEEGTLSMDPVSVSREHRSVHPHFLYCLPLISCTSLKNVNSLSLIQRKCIRTIAKARYNAHYEPLFYELKILPFTDLILHQKLLFMHSIAFSYAPPSFYMDQCSPGIEILRCTNTP